MDRKRDTLQFQVLLREIEPPVWRRVEVRLSLVFRRDPKQPSQWSYTMPDADHLVLAGVVV